MYPVLQTVLHDDCVVAVPLLFLSFLLHHLFDWDFNCTSARSRSVRYIFVALQEDFCQQGHEYDPLENTSTTRIMLPVPRVHGVSQVFSSLQVCGGLWEADRTGAGVWSHVEGELIKSGIHRLNLCGSWSLFGGTPTEHPRNLFFFRDSRAKWLLE